MSLNLYKNFIPLGWKIAKSNGCISYIHPDSIYDDPKCGVFRKFLYTHLVKHFQFRNEMKIFPIHNTRAFSINIYINGKQEVAFESISNLFSVSSIDKCYSIENDGSIDIGIKDSDGKWNTNGCNDRIIYVKEKELKLFAEIFDGDVSYLEARLPMLQCNELLTVLEKMNDCKYVVGDLGNNIIATEMWNEKGAQTEGLIERKTVFPEDYNQLILSGSHLGLGNAFMKTPSLVCNSNKAFDEISIWEKQEQYVPRTNYIRKCSIETYNERMTKAYGKNINQFYRLASRKMIDPLTERTLISAIIPPGVDHINGLVSIVFKNNSDLVNVTSLFMSLPYDFFIKSTGKTNLYFELQKKMPMVNRYKKERCVRTLLLNCVNLQFDALWKEVWDDSYRTDSWTKEDSLLSKSVFLDLTCNSSYSERRLSDYQRRQLFIELDVLSAMEFGFTLNELLTIYRIQFPVLNQYEDTTFYDTSGKMVYSSKNRGNLLCDTKEWKNSINLKKIEHVIEDDTNPEGPIKKIIKFNAPFICADREQDYKDAWNAFNVRIGGN